jgi:hypothetical protein
MKTKGYWFLVAAMVLGLSVSGFPGTDPETPPIDSSRFYPMGNGNFSHPGGYLPPMGSNPQSHPMGIGNGNPSTCTDGTDEWGFGPMWGESDSPGMGFWDQMIGWMGGIMGWDSATGKIKFSKRIVFEKDCLLHGK